MFALKNPDRLVIDCRPASVISPVSTTLAGKHPDVIRIRADQYQPNVVRIVFDLKRQAKYSAFMNGNQLRIRITDKRKAAPVQAQEHSVARDQSQQVSLSKAERPDASVKNPQGTTDNIQMSVSTLDQRAPRAPDEAKNKTKAKEPRVKMQGWLVDKYRRNVVRGQDSEPSMTNSYSMAVKYRDKNKNSTFRVAYEITGHEYMESFVDDYMSHDFKIGYEFRLAPKWTLKTAGRAEMDEYLGNRYGFRPELEYRIDRDSAIAFFGGHRTKVYHDYRDRIDQDRFIGMAYMRKLGKHRLELEYQRNFNDSEKARQDYINTKYAVAYHIPWTNRVRTLFKLDYSPREYQSRFVDYHEFDREFGTLRHDQGWTFSITSRFALTKTFEIVPRYVYQDRYSNDPLIEEKELHVPSISLRGRW